MSEQTNITSEINENTNLTGGIYINQNGMKTQIVSMNCSLTKDSIATITTSIFNQELFKSNMEGVNAELIKFKTQAAAKGKELNCLVF
ncbi:hypothetical protein [Clostridium perfringens]|uniref:hypothetical protein n=1 Tax=Clostridium perfringens TaxID=1502 RepID=UPI0008A69078|nr:hypothetical protein [Clostridium perfringens]DAJ44202.1 MAG TPA: hypothetical protein [Caudoviricetes sp.]AOY53359.1 Hypothetical protein FORC25_0941 [Clostridium perfringens]MDK0679996.1 hypothetical protein [Clostridium perfringens]MDK0856464.1 hypothetical protein [Clostridium perfringens]UUW66916.1 hypothetical protein NQ197_04860 [Clostridium perfringens]